MALEAYDLMPVVECLKRQDADAVQQCMDAIEPWLNINEGGKLALSVNAVNGFIGGSVGVVGTVIATLVKKGQVKDRLKCTYCEGEGEIICGVCLGRGTVQIPHADGSWSMGKCDTCEGTGTVVCINCQGSGLCVPDDFLQVLGDSEMGFSDEDYIGLFDEVKFPTVEPAADQLPDSGSGPAAAPKKEPVGAAGAKADFDPIDELGGLG